MLDNREQHEGAEGEDEQIVHVRGIASNVLLDRGRGVAIKAYRRNRAIEALYRLAFQAKFPYVDNMAALKASRYRRQIAGLITQYFLGRDVIAPVVAVEHEGDRYLFVTELVRGSEPSDHGRARAFLHEVTNAFIASGLPTWQVTPHNPRSLGNLMENEDGEYVIIDLESNVVTPMIPLSAAWRSAREGHLPPFDDIDLARLCRFIDNNREEIEIRLGPDGSSALLEATAKYAWYERLWHGDEPRLWSRTLRGLTRLLDFPAHFRALGRRISGWGAHADLAEGWLESGISRWVDEGRLTSEQASVAKRDLTSGESMTVMAHLGAHIVMSIPLRFPFGSIARFLWTAAFRLRAEARALIHRHAGEETRRAREVHSLVVMFASAVPGAGAAAYVLAAPMRRNRTLMAIAIDQGCRLLPLGIYERLHLAAVTSSIAGNGATEEKQEDVTLTRLPVAAVRGIPALRHEMGALLVLGFAALVLLAGLASYLLTDDVDAFEEWGYIATLKVALSFAAAALGVLYFRRFWVDPAAEFRAQAPGTIFWLVAGLAIAWIAVDDHLQLHEDVTNLLPDWSVLDHVDELTMVAYFIVAVALARFFRRELVSSAAIPTLIGAGLVFIAVAIGTDALVSRDRDVSALEEAAHFAAVAAFVAALVVKHGELGAIASGDTVRALASGTARAGSAPSARNVAHWVSWVVVVTVFLGLTALIADGGVYSWEVDVTRWIQEHEVPEWAFRAVADELTNSDTPLGSVIIMSVAMAFLLLKQYIAAFLVLLSIPLHVLANFPKAFIERGQPAEAIDGIIEFEGMNSFPSGHAEFAVTFYGLLAYLVFVRIENLPIRVAVILAWLGMVVAVGYARLSVGKHLPMDIVAGYVVGLGILSGLVWLHRSLVRATATAATTNESFQDAARPSTSISAEQT